MMQQTSQLIRKGKVRDLYDIGYNLMLLRHSDRVSSFDRIWCDIEGKGKILNSTSVWWFNRTKHIIQNHLLYASPGGRDMIVKKCTIFPIEFVVRGYITGSTKTSLWTHYNNGERVYCGIKFPEGLKKNQKLVEPVLTPTTKGDADDPISAEQIVERGIMTLEDWNICSTAALKLFRYGQKLAQGAGLILVDTKYEFGIYEKTGDIVLIDEVHTCDSSRFWKLDTYPARFQSGMEPEKFDKDLIRTYVKTQCDPYETKPSDVTIPSDIKDKVRCAYAEFYRVLTGTKMLTNDCDMSVDDVAEDYFDKRHRDRVYIVSDSDSKNEKTFVEKISKSLKDLDIYSEWEACSPRKETKRLIKYLETCEKHARSKNHRVVYITIEGQSNALSSIVACNTSNPVIACPSFQHDFDMMIRASSALQMPSKTPVMTILDPENVAMAVDRMFRFNV
jgi:phosphoribosylaminoimidazole-succinocarboxamide synthase